MPSNKLEPDFRCVTRRFGIAVFLIAVLMGQLAADESADLAKAAERIRGEFVRLDADGDGQIELGEFAGMVGDPLVRQRDFRLFDFDGNGHLSRAEFSCLPGLVEPHLRGTMPDPLDGLIDDAVVALDESYDRWDRRPDELVSAHTFVNNFLESISPEKKRFVTGRIIDKADGDGDGKVSRSEAKHFLEQQLGMRRKSGPPLRELTGRLVRFDRFLAMDVNHDGALSREEFDAGWWKRSLAKNVFDAIDRDRNGRASYEEYSHPLSPTFIDPIEWFRDADTDLDTKLDEDELRAAVEPDRWHLAVSGVRSFDDDKDRTLSLREYRLSMLGNYNYPWDHRPLDQDRDGRLSYDEFVFNEADLFQLQRWYYFHRLDLDQDGSLSLEEFEFRPLAPLSIRAYSTTDGDVSRLVYQDGAYPDCGWPSVSPDGTQVLLHACPPVGPSEGRIIAISLGDNLVRTVCRGIQPSWSADGEFFVCERRSRDAGIWILDAGGLRGRRVAAGHSPKWSPDGRSIAFLHDNGVSIFELQGDQTRPILLREDHPYQDLGSDIAWSPDSRRLALLGNFAASSQLLILPVDPGKAGQVRIRYSFDVCCRGNLSWNALDGILVGIREAESPAIRLLSLAPDSDQRPELVERLQNLVGCRSACLTPDGEWYITVVED